MRNTEKDAKEMSAKRELMLEVGFKIFAENVIEAVSMNDVAKACGLGIATLYRYFATKLEFVIAIGTRQWKNYYLEIEELYKKSDGENMNAVQEFDFYLDAYITLYKNHKDILRFNRNFDTYIRHERATAEQMQPYNEAVKVFARKFHIVYAKAEQDGTLNTDIPEEKLFISAMYTMLPVAAKYAEGLVYPEEKNNHDMSGELITLKKMILREYITEKGRNFYHEN
ncbi:MAG: TetR/AcrR family transcriptional regulator [Synergistaceae bacterium]|nr:TetR/AcrR family transcriptional regulator [Synergistaceae bacterium]MBR0203308.1 TetR/AcrR family transcriptional regulator [Synergistaceae bacterium]